LVASHSRRHTRIGYPRNTTGVGLTLRAGFIPEHATAPLRAVDALQKSALHLEVSGDWSAVVTDATFGTFDRYLHALDEYSVGASVKVFGARAGFSFNWQRMLFNDPLATYPSRATIDNPFHGYGRASLELTY
jgi:hypothetical protein